jgi:hypothetical protein
VVVVGIAQEKTPVWRSWKAKGQEQLVHPHMEWGRQMAFVNHFCFWCATRRVKRFFWRWQKRLPSPFTHEDLRAGHVYELAFRQFEISDTRVFHRPAAGRSFFDQLIRDHLNVGRPESVSLIFDRRIIQTTPGTWRTKVITKGVAPQISCYYKSSRIKQYFKEQRALRTETGHLQHPRLRHRPAGHRREREGPTGGWRQRQPASR